MDSPLPTRRPIVLGIAGCSGSGKSTLARELACELDATLIPLDRYYRDLAPLSFEERAATNFDHPDSIECGLLIAHLRTLAAGQPVDCPVYDFTLHLRVPGRTQRLHPAPVLIVEGILALHYPELRALYDFALFVDAPHALCLTRRIHRDVHERNRTEESVREQFAATTRPMADLYVLPSAAHAQLTVHGTEALDWALAQTLRALHERRLLS